MAISSVGSSNPIYSAIAASKSKGADASSLANTTATDDSVDSFTQSLADSNPDVASALANLRSTQSLLGLADATFSGNSSAFADMFGTNSSDPYMLALTAAYVTPIQSRYDAFLKHQAAVADGTGATANGTANIDLDAAGLSISATGKADEGKYTLAYDKSMKTFTLVGGDFQITAALPTNTDGTAKKSLDFGNGITLNIGDDFNAAKSIKAEKFSVSY
jgi:hypothetical protein